MTTSPITITAELLDDLQRKAKAATPGPWEHIRHRELSMVASDEWELLDIRCDQPNDNADGEFIAAANPAVVDALVEHIRSLTERLERAEKDAGWISVEDRLPDEHKAEYLCLFGGGDQQVTEWIHDETEGWVFWYGYPTHWRTLPATPSIAQEKDHE